MKPEDYVGKEIVWKGSIPLTIDPTHEVAPGEIFEVVSLDLQTGEFHCKTSIFSFEFSVPSFDYYISLGVMEVSAPVQKQKFESAHLRCRGCKSPDRIIIVELHGYFISCSYCPGCETLLITENCPVEAMEMLAQEIYSLGGAHGTAFYELDHKIAHFHSPQKQKVEDPHAGMIQGYDGKWRWL